MNPKQLRINLLLPFPVTKPIGGPKVMYEYANRLARRGHSVTLLHPVARPYKKTSTPVWLKQLLFALRGASRPKWFPLNRQVASKIIPSAEAQYVPDADATVCTWWEMAYMLDRFPAAKGAKFNLIQDYEIWSGNEDLVRKSYRLPLNHICISRHLQKLVAEESGVMPLYLPNAVDTEKFTEIVAPQGRHPRSVIMLYSTEPRKGTSYGLKALQLLREKFVDLQATLFGVVESKGLPDWINYHRRPHNLVALYNEHAVFLTPSITEGWALPPAEAMCCGCAVVCTDIGGHKDYAVDGKTSLVVPPESPHELANAAAKLMDDRNLRMKLARNGAEHIQTNFDWERNTDALINFFTESSAMRKTSE
jgi:glycosyltransferase involved in cell wall biosynthesis